MAFQVWVNFLDGDQVVEVDADDWDDEPRFTVFTKNGADIPVTALATSSILAIVQVLE